MDEGEVGIRLEDGRVEQDEPDVDAERGLHVGILSDWGFPPAAAITEMLTMPSLSARMPWSRILRRVLSRAPSTSPLGGPSRKSLSRDMASAAKDRLLKAEERLAAVMVVNCWGLGRGGASLLARPLCGERLKLTFLRGGEGGLWW